MNPDLALGIRHDIRDNDEPTVVLGVSRANGLTEVTVGSVTVNPLTHRGRIRNRRTIRLADAEVTTLVAHLTSMVEGAAA